MSQYEFILDLRNSGASWEQVAAAFSKAYQKTNAECVRKLFSRLKRGVEPPPPPRQVVHGRRPKSPVTKEDNSRILLISDMHIPYQHQDTVAFLTAVRAKYKPTRVVCVGDELDKHALSFHDSDPDLASAGDELSNAIAALQPIYALFPNMDLVDSNHGSMVYRKSKAHGIPRKYIRDYGDVLVAPTGWNWHLELLIDIPGGNQLLVHHGLSKDVMKVVAQRGVCVAQGHYHIEFRIGYLGNPNHLLWGINVGCSIDSKSLAFAYDRNNLGRPIIGHGIIIDGLPKLLPMVLDGTGRWIGVVP